MVIPTEVVERFDPGVKTDDGWQLIKTGTCPGLRYSPGVSCIPKFRS